MEPTALGIAFIVLGFFLFLIEVTQPGFLMAVPATVAMVLGALFLVWPDVTESWTVVPILLVVTVISLTITIKAYQHLAPPDAPSTGDIAGLNGREGVVTREVTPDSLSGKVRLGTEIVSARAETTIPEGSRVRVLHGEGIHIVVEPIVDIINQEKKEGET